MQQPEIRYQVNQPAVVAEVFDNEIVIIHLESGSYYNIQKSGVAIWLLAVRGATASEIAHTIATQYQSDYTKLHITVQSFLAELQQADLIVQRIDNPYDSPASILMPKSLAVQQQNPRFEPPVFNEFTDMQELLLLDPIHEVDHTGWPTRKVT